MNLFVQLVSLVGAALILTAFIGLQRSWWPAQSAGYQWANFLGALLLVGVAVWDRRIGFVILEAVWALVSLWSIFAPPRGSMDRRPA
jgi:hypothetical protein